MGVDKEAKEMSQFRVGHVAPGATVMEGLTASLFSAKDQSLPVKGGTGAWTAAGSVLRARFPFG